MKYVKTFEAYIAYSDYEKKSSRWGKPADIQEDLEMKIMNMLKYGGINNHLEDVEFEDQSNDQGIKWEITVIGRQGIEKIHAYKKTTYRGEYELYLNKKKSSEYEIQQYFLNKYISELDTYIASMNSYDIHHDRSDDSRAFKAGSAHAKQLQDMYANLSSSDKKKAAEAFAKKHNVKTDYKTFNGIS
jgi:hypothetical protein